MLAIKIISDIPEMEMIIAIGSLAKRERKLIRLAPAANTNLY